MDLIDPAVRPLLDGGATVAPLNFHAVAGPSELVPSATRGSATPMAVWRFEHDGQTYHAVYVPRADESARLVAVVRA